ncbi:MAG: MBL fold metallo-hydrolase [Spirochaetaceae bacterium]|jgi:glyoxylase-like metal-dependent hydrolase (beta-lactamase superfamily II)|nr:MBL fold metallo-hydrolase [Spirochaetaceae bacterium]
MNNNIARLEVGAFSTNCWVYVVDGDVSVIDPGGDGEAIIAFLESERLKPARILLTHGHFDHVMALPDVRGAFPDGTIAVHRADHVSVGKNAFRFQCADFKTAAGNDGFIRENWRDMPPVTQLLEDGDTIGPFTVMHTPGHTKGSVSYYHKDAGVLFSGDTLFCGGIGRTDLSGGSIAEMTESLKRLFSLDGETRVFPGHGGPTTIKAERAGLVT